MATEKATTKKTKKKVEPQAFVTLILKKPRITEKAAKLSSKNIYLFDVDANTTKREIAKAFEAQYKKKPLSVNTVSMRPKSYFRRGKLGFGSAGKKAYIALPKGVTIEIA